MIVIVSILSGVFSILLLSKDSSIQLTRRTNKICDPLYDDNIGYRSFSDVTCFPQIDAVYTWVNGSDPIWLADMQFYTDNKTYADRLVQPEQQFSQREKCII